MWQISLIVLTNVFWKGFDGGLGPTLRLSVQNLFTSEIGFICGRSKLNQYLLSNHPKQQTLMKKNRNWPISIDKIALNLIVYNFPTILSKGYVDKETWHFITKWRNALSVGRHSRLYLFYYGLTLTPACINNHMPNEVFAKSLTHSQTSASTPLKFGHG